jgi:hypothetical protein
MDAHISVQDAPNAPSLSANVSSDLPLARKPVPVYASEPSLPDEEQARMMRTVEEVFHLDESLLDPNSMANSVDFDPDDVSQIELEDQVRRTARLRKILAVLQQLLASGSNCMALATEKLADGCRDCKSEAFLLFMFILFYCFKYLPIVLEYCPLFTPQPSVIPLIIESVY